MVLAPRRTRWRKLAATCCLAGSLGWLAACTNGHRATGLPRVEISSSGFVGPPLRVLQLNLCNSGIASCYTGRSVSVAADLIRDTRPDVVTLNEICRDDVSLLEEAMSGAHPGATIDTAFKAAPDRLAAAPFRCRNGQEYGIGVLAATSGSVLEERTYGGSYPIQDVTDPEERVWSCVHAEHEFYACTTHTANTSTEIALDQCRYLLHTAVPAMRHDGGDDPVIIGADFNLFSHRAPEFQRCLPTGYQQADDGARQHVLAGLGITVASRTLIDMRRSTDHPGLLVELARTPIPVDPPGRAAVWRDRSLVRPQSALARGEPA